MNITSNEFAAYCFDESIAICEMIPLSMVTADAMPDALEEFLEEVDGKEFDRLFGDGSWSRIYREHDDEGPDGDAFCEFLVERHEYGFLMQISRPVKSPTKDGLGASYTSGHRNLRWIYSKDLSDVHAQIDAFCKERWAKECANVGAPVVA